MFEHSLPRPADRARPPMIPLPVALYVSGELIFELYDGERPVPEILDPLGVARSSEGKRARGSSEFPNGLRPTPRLVPAFHAPPDADFHLIAVAQALNGMAK